MLKPIIASLVVILFASNTKGSNKIDKTWIKKINSPQYFAVLVTDVDKAANWYQTVFGLEKLDDVSAEDLRWRIVNLANEKLRVEIIYDQRARINERSIGFFKVGFEVTDVRIIAKYVSSLVDKEIKVLEIKKHGIRIIQLEDPDGNKIQLSSKLD